MTRTRALAATPRNQRARVRALARALVTVLVAARAAALAGDSDSDWRLLGTSEAARTARAIAAAAETGGLAFGDAHGVFALEADGRTRLLLRRGPVGDLAALAPAPGERAPVWLAATARGLYRIDADGRVAAAALGPGVAAKGIARLAAAPGLAAAAGEDGVFVSGDGRAWQRLDGLPAGPAQAVALRAAPAGFLCISAHGEELWRSFVTTEQDAAPGLAARWTSVSARLEPRPPGIGPILDLITDVPGAELVALREDSAARFTRAGQWRALATPLPPGAALRRLELAADRLWVASDRGLASAPSAEGPWSLAGGLAGRTEVVALAGQGGRVYAASALGILVAGDPAAPRAGSAAVPGARPASAGPAEAEPEIRAVHRAAIAYLGLGGRGIRELAEGVRRRGWLPSVSLHAGYQRDRDQGADLDESFTSGELRELHDRDWARGREVDVGVIATWELADLAYHPESIDVAKEARERIELRDDVLDELNQLYFERRRVLLELAQEPDADSPVAARLRLRAAELAAGIDGWTGGWFTRRLRERQSPPLSPGPAHRSTP
jgi:hypothetical protein